MKKIALAALAMAAIGAQAADEGAYVGLNTNHVKLSCDTCTGSAQNAVGMYGGYRMGAIAGEVSRFQKTDEFGVKLVITDFVAIPRYNVAKDVDLLGKIGIRHAEVSDSTEKFTGNSLVVGVGMEYTLMPQVAVRAMVDYSNKTLKVFDQSIKATTTTVGVAYKF